MFVVRLRRGGCGAPQVLLPCGAAGVDLGLRWATIVVAGAARARQGSGAAARLHVRYVAQQGARGRMCLERAVRARAGRCAAPRQLGFTAAEWDCFAPTRALIPAPPPAEVAAALEWVTRQLQCTHKAELLFKQVCTHPFHASKAQPGRESSAKRASAQNRKRRRRRVRSERTHTHMHTRAHEQHTHEHTHTPSARTHSVHTHRGPGDRLVGGVSF